ncbi:PaaI family thioesterase [Actinomadura fulvescens]|uniref:PaaI family thioesterase n=1 Tax=Actinomadura fulvescens TaxID=46160 RepID=A0ABP6CAA5_9ACTN
MRADLHEPFSDGRDKLFADFFNNDESYFGSLVGLQLEDVRVDYARMRLPYRPRLNQPAGVVHGGAIATLIDTVVVPAIGGVYERIPVLLTIDMQLRYLSAARETDLVAEGWITRRGKSTVFCQAEVRGTDGEVVAEGWHVYRVILPKD